MGSEEVRLRDQSAGGAEVRSSIGGTSFQLVRTDRADFAAIRTSWKLVPPIAVLKQIIRFED